MYPINQKLVCIANCYDGIYFDACTGVAAPGPKKNEIVTFDGYIPNGIYLKEYNYKTNDIRAHWPIHYFVPVLNSDFPLEIAIENTLDVKKPLRVLEPA